MKLPSENQRVKFLIDHYFEGNVNQFSQKIGVSQPRISRLFHPDKRSGKFPVATLDILQSIINEYPTVNAKWLLNGDGSFEENQDKAFSAEPIPNHRKTPDALIDKQLIPLFNFEATASIVTLFKDKESLSPVDYLQIPNLPKSDGAIYVTGDSMYPLLKSGDIIIYKEVHNSIDSIYWGEMYLISTDIQGDEMTTVKWIHRSELGTEYVKLVSQNQHHQPKDVHISQIKALALIKASVRFNSMG